MYKKSSFLNKLNTTSSFDKMWTIHYIFCSKCQTHIPLVEQSCVATGNNAYKRIKQMIKIISKVEIHFFLICPGVFGDQTCTQQVLQTLTIWTVRASQIQTMCVGEMWLSGQSVILSPTCGPNTKIPPYDAPFPEKNQWVVCSMYGEDEWMNDVWTPLLGVEIHEHTKQHIF